MPTHHSPVVALGHCERERLEFLLRAGSTPQSLAFRCRLILRIAQPDQPTNLRVAADLGCNRNTVEKWRHRYLQDGLPGPVRYAVPMSWRRPFQRRRRGLLGR